MEGNHKVNIGKYLLRNKLDEEVELDAFNNTGIQIATNNKIYNVYVPIP